MMMHSKSSLIFRPCLAFAAALLLSVLSGGCGGSTADAKDETASPAVETETPASTVAQCTAPPPSGPLETAIPPPDETAAPAATAARTASPSPSGEAEIKPAVAAVSAEILAAEFATVADSYYNNKGFSSNRYAYTAEELAMLATVIYLEAGGESYRAKIAVGNVVMNRVLSSGYPGSTIREVVTAPNQFCYSSSAEPDAECLRAARDVLRYETWVVPQNTYFFRATSSTSDWGDHQYYGHIGDTAFYREEYSGRYNGDAVPSPLYKRTYQWPRYGCRPGERVRKIQIMLSALGYETKADGYFGSETEKRLMEFQKDHRLTVDGIAGPKTLAALIKLYGINRYLRL
jgi:spore germination cell wall hydrolase CwlJ-like protein